MIQQGPICDNMVTRRFFKNTLCLFRFAHSVSEFVGLIGISGKNVGSIGYREELDLALTIFNEEFNGKKYKKKLSRQSLCLFFKVRVKIFW